jgi:hypothetical protein
MPPPDEEPDEDPDDASALACEPVLLDEPVSDEAVEGFDMAPELPEAGLLAALVSAAPPDPAAPEAPDALDAAVLAGLPMPVSAALFWLMPPPAVPPAVPVEARPVSTFSG